jgi:hypothetical protein
VDESVMRELMQVKERVQAYSHIVSQKLMTERTAHLQVCFQLNWPRRCILFLQCAFIGVL